jgi:LemA protein
MTIDASTLTPETLKTFQAQQGQLGAAMGRLMMVTEQYPQLRATEQFRDLSAQLEGTENRIKVARDEYNSTATEYNKSIHRFPGSLFAKNFDFTEFPLFTADSAAQHAPTIKFNIK